MSAHADDGLLLAYLDRELPAHERAELEVHLGSCLPCRGALSRVRRRAELVNGGLALLDVPAPTGAAWAAVQLALGSAAPAARPGPARTAAPRRQRPGWFAGHWTLARAAGLVLLLAGGAAAAVIPGSPVRAWLFGDDEATAVTATAPAADQAPAAAESGSWTRPVDGEVTLALTAPAGTAVEVAWAGARAGFQGPADTRYSSRQDGELEAQAPGGPVRVEIPADIRAATLTVNGVAVLIIADGQATASPASGEGELVPGGIYRFQVD